MLEAKLMSLVMLKKEQNYLQAQLEKSYNKKQKSILELLVASQKQSEDLKKEISESVLKEGQNVEVRDGSAKIFTKEGWDGDILNQLAVEFQPITEARKETKYVVVRTK